MLAGYTILGRPTPHDLTQAVAKAIGEGWIPQGGPFTAPLREGSKLKVHANNPVLGWFQAMVLPAAVAAQYATAVEEPAASQGPGKQALSAAEVEELAESLGLTPPALPSRLERYGRDPIAHWTPARRQFVEDYPGPNKRSMAETEPEPK